MTNNRKVYIHKGPGKYNYFITDSPISLAGRNLGQAFYLWSARRVARKVLRKAPPPEPRYVLVEEVEK